MKSPIRIALGAVAIVIGLVWFFQGIGRLAGSPMTGVGFWAWAGAALVIIGLLVIFRPGRPRDPDASEGPTP
ncbi:MAG: hypothetical protein WCP95_11525 [Actinomycetes bacterium]